MAERCVEAVLHDGVAVGSILALTFTEKAAGELRDRIRRRFVALGEEEHARAVDAGWIGTIHGFCARILRARPLAAGLDPRFDVLDEPAAERLAGEAYERAFEEWARERGAPAIDVAAAYGAGLKDIVLNVHATLRSRGETRPVLRVPPAGPAPDAAGLTTARAAAARHLLTAGAGVRLDEGRAALDVCERLLADAAGAIPVPTALAAAELKKNAKALGEPPSEAYRTAFNAYRQSCADHHARAVLEEIAVLLARFGARYAEAKAQRAGLDFEDLELGVRDLLAADPEDRRRWAERFALIMVDEFQDTNRLQLDVLEALERDNLFAVGDEFQSIYGFRHADVTIFRERRAALGEDRVRLLTANFRSREELLDVLNSAYAPQWPERFAPLLAGNGTAPDDGGELRLFDPGDPGGAVPSVELLVTDSLRLGRRHPARARRRRDQAAPAGRGARARPPPARGGRRRPAGARHRRARPRDGVPARARGGARGAGRDHLRGRRPRLLVPAAGPRRHRLPRRARQPARRGGAARRPRLAVLRRRLGRPDPARRRRPRERRRDLGRAARGRPAPAASPPGRRSGCGSSRRSSPTSGRTRSGCPSRCCSSAGSRGPGTTSRSSRGRAGSGGSRTSAS